MEGENRSYGPHLMLDLAGCNAEILDDLDACFELLNKLPEEIGMTKITQPYVFRYRGLVPEDEGITGVTVIAESHISLHTYPIKGFAFVDLFSCRPFDVKSAAEHIVQFFECKSPAIHMQHRGKAFPATIRLAS
jgi:S-adenosylmethionine decarboxylase